MADKIFQLIESEKKRQRETLMMIPSENYTYPEVREVVGSVLMHKYAEGDPGRRYYQGNEFVDEIERICKKRTLEAFKLNSNEWAVNVQPHSGCEANLAVYNAILDPSGKILSMYLPDGGHLSHGWYQGEKKTTFVSKVWDVSFYHVEEKSKVFDYEKIEKIAAKAKPKLIISGGTAYPREIDYEKMALIAKKVGAYYMADVAHEAGLIVGGASKSPFPHADFVTFTTHKTLRGPRGAVIVSRKEFGVGVDRSIIPGLQGGPHLHSIAGIAVALEKSKSKKFKDYAKQTVKNAKHLAKELANKGFDVVSRGTDKHLILIDLRNKELNGWFAAWALEAAGIIVNRNTVPFDTGSPFYPSGLRLGTPALTVRGMKEKEMEMITRWIDEVINSVGKHTMPEDKDERVAYLMKFKTDVFKDKKLLHVKSEVKKLCERFPVDLS